MSMSHVFRIRNSVVWMGLGGWVLDGCWVGAGLEWVGVVMDGFGMSGVGVDGCWDRWDIGWVGGGWGG